jgi:DNA-binding beta-propeller fold protein YncE
MPHPRIAATAAALAVGAPFFALLCAPAAAGQMHSAPLPQGAQFAPAQAHGSPSVAAYRHAMDLVRKAHGAKKSPHFSYPFGLGSDGLGNVYVTNLASSSVTVVGANLKAIAGVITQGLFQPVSVTADGLGNVYVGNLNSGVGSVTKYTNGQPQMTISANTATPYSIALDAFDDLYVVNGAGIAVDDPYGSQIFGSEYNGYGVVSVAAGNASIYGFFNDGDLVGNGSVFLRTGALQAIVGPTGSTSPLGVACAENACWYSDSADGTLSMSMNGNVNATPLNYTPVGVAYDPTHNRVFVADPANNAVHVYNPSTLALEKTII